MTVQIQGVPLNKILTFPFQDSQSRKRLLALFGLSLAGMFIPILPGFFVAGYSIQILRQAVREGTVVMPEWKDLNRLLVDGLSAAVIGLAYLLPGIIILFCGLIIYFVSFMAIIPQSQQAESFPPITIILPMIVLFTAIGLGSLLLIAGAIPLPAALARFADEGKIGAAFQIREIGRALKANPIGYLGAWIVFLGIYTFASYLYSIMYMTMVCCCIGILFLLIGAGTGAIIFMAMVGLAYRQGKAEASTA